MVGILFDLDGTLLDTLDDLTASVNAALASFGYPPRTRQEVRCFVGNGAARLIQRAVPEGKGWEQVLEAFQLHYRENCQIRTAPYPGIPEALRKLSEKYPVAIVSNKPDAAVKKLCARYFPGICAMGETGKCPRKPAPDMVRLAMEQIGVERCVYVGDSEVDILTAKNAGVPCLSVLWGFRDRSDLPDAFRFCDTPEKLPPVLDALAEEIKIKEENYGK